MKKGGYCLIKKNAILIRNRLRVMVSMLGGRGVPGPQSFSNTKRVFVDNSNQSQSAQGIL